MSIVIRQRRGGIVDVVIVIGIVIGLGVLGRGTVVVVMLVVFVVAVVVLMVVVVMVVNFADVMFVFVMFVHVMSIVGGGGDGFSRRPYTTTTILVREFPHDGGAGAREVAVVGAVSDT